MEPIHTLLVNDSLLVSRVIKKILATQPMLNPIGWAKNGLEAESYVSRNLPDVILMDIHMPQQNGVETTKKILAIHTIPILLVTSTIKSNMTEIFQCMQYGALEAVKPPQDPLFRNIDQLSTEQLSQLGAPFINKIMTIARLKHLVNATAAKSLRMEFKPPAVVIPVEPATKAASDLVVIGSSTGGPAALAQVLRCFPGNFPAATIIVQHMDAEFLPSLISYLQQYSGLPIQMALEGERPRMGHVYLAHKAGRHLKCARDRTFTYCSQPVLTHMPSIDILFDSVAENFGRNVTGVVLTGMGKDGATGLKNIRDHDGLTLSQDEESSVVYGMPKAAAELQASVEVLPVMRIGPRIVSHACRFC